MTGIAHMEKSILNFISTLLSGKFAEAERSLERMDKRFKNPEEKRALHALRGLLNSYQADDRESLIYRVFSDVPPERRAKELLEELENHLKHSLSGGDTYFDVWVLILRNIKKLPTPHRLKAEDQSQVTGEAS
ncbi:MAG: hypothetical protein RMJ28_02300 [Nitrososphaerota archaeon]|nr:hypothetical protein [Candidatus Calditenuaceae archaeon]MDW8073053.1 hypothetical protein [Nitrososphaerota archaeon]